MRHAPLYAVILTMMVVSVDGPAAFAQLPASTAIAGGRGGTPFLDPELQAGARVLEVHVRSGDTVDSVQMLIALPDGRTAMSPRHGGSGGDLNVFRLEAGEYIIGLSGRHGDTIDSMRIHTNRRTSPVYGGRGGDHDFRVDVQPGTQAVGFTGRAGDLVDAIGLICVPIREAQAGQTAIAGGRGGSAFADSEFQEGARIAEVRVRAGDAIDAVQAVFILADGRRVEGKRHGGGGGRETIFSLDSDEYIIGLAGRYGDTIDSLQIRTNKRTSQIFGGRGGDHDYRIDIPAGSRATGFAGRAGDLLDAIGLTYAATSAPSRRFQWPRRTRG